MSSSSESDSETYKPTVSRLGDCEVCASTEAIYTCPKCEVKTCSLSCITIHKNELECNGIRDRTKFIRMKHFTDMDLLSDYRLLEECARFAYGVKNDKKKRFTRIDKDLPVHLFKLKLAARKQGIVLHFLAQNFTRHSINTTRYNYKTNIIQWRIEWIFPNGEPDPIKFSDDKCLEGSKLSELLDKYVNPDAAPFDGSKSLLYYKAAGFNGIKVLLKAEKVRSSSKKFFELDVGETLAENLSGKCIVEFPIIFIVLKDHAYNFDIVTPEDEFDYDKVPSKDKVVNKNDESENNSQIVREVGKNMSNGDSNDINGTQMAQYEGFENRLRKRPKRLLTEKIAQEKILEIKKEIKEQRKKKPKNLLFTTGYSSDESLGDSNSENEDIKMK